MLKVEKIEKFSKLPFSVKKFLQFYPWKDCSPVSTKSIKKDLCESKVAIVSSAGLIVKGVHDSFDLDIKLGDPTFRIIRSDTNPELLQECHRSQTFDHSAIKNDPYSAFPIPHLISLKNEGFIGSVSNRHISLMGSIINTSELERNTIPEIISILKSDFIDIVIFIPV